jgi:hypothetical protein
VENALSAVSNSWWLLCVSIDDTAYAHRLPWSARAQRQDSGVGASRRGTVRKRSAGQSKTAVGGQRWPSGKSQVSKQTAAPPQVRGVAEWFITNSASTLDMARIDV